MQPEQKEGRGHAGWERTKVAMARRHFDEKSHFGSCFVCYFGCLRSKFSPPAARFWGACGGLAQRLRRGPDP